MTVPARVEQGEPEVDVNAALETLAPRIGRGDMSALVEFLEIRGARVTDFHVRAEG